MRTQKTPTKDRIIKEATDLVFKYGFAGTSIDLILEKVGITKGAFFYHFESKADLALAMLKKFSAYDHNRLYEAIRNTERYSDDPKKRLLEFVQFFINFFNDLQEPPGCLYASISNEQNLYNEEVKNLVVLGFQEWQKVFEKLLEDLSFRYRPKIEIDKKILSGHFNVVLEGAFVLSNAMNNEKLPSLHLEHFKNYLNLLWEEKE